MTSLSIVKHFSKIEDPRVLGRVDHKLIDIIVITVCAVVANAEGWEEIEDYALRKESLLRKFLELPSGIPSHDTFRRVIGMIEPDEINPCFTAWVNSLVKSGRGDIIALDGKTARRSGSPTRGKKPIHIVSAWSCGTGVVLGQRACDEKSNEIKAVPELLKHLDLKDKIVTTDALNSQKAIAKQVRNAGGDYVFALKSNAGNIYGECQRVFEKHCQRRWRGATYDWYKVQEKGHGRKEVRKSCDVMPLLPPLLSFKPDLTPAISPKHFSLAKEPSENQANRDAVFRAATHRSTLQYRGNTVMVTTINRPNCSKA